MSPPHKLLSLCIAGVSVFFCDGAIATPQDQSSAKLATSTDPKTGVTFPKRLGVFERKRGVEYDAAGYPMAAYLAGQMILLSVFYYKDKPFSTEYANCRDYVKIVTPNARLISDGPSNLHSSGRRAVFTFEGQFLGSSKIKLMSELMMFPHRNHYLTFRITYPSAHAERARQEIDSFVRAFKLP